MLSNRAKALKTSFTAFWLLQVFCFAECRDLPRYAPRIFDRLILPKRVSHYFAISWLIHTPAGRTTAKQTQATAQVNRHQMAEFLTERRSENVYLPSENRANFQARYGIFQGGLIQWLTDDVYAFTILCRKSLHGAWPTFLEVISIGTRSITEGFRGGLHRKSR